MAARVEVLRPPDERLTAWQWARRNLFDGLWNSLLTLLTVAALLFFASMILRWAARAHWSVITDNPRFWLMGLMPVELAPRAFWAGGLVAAAALLTLGGVRVRVAPRVLFGLWVGIIIAVIWVMSPVRLDQIGGLYLTLLLAVVSIALSFPIGVLVGMGRVSRLPAIRVFSILYIELIRGIPLITILLWFFIFVALVSGGALSRVERAMVGLIIFTSAYVGEIVRAGIQSVPRGQTEAARAVGLSAVQTMRFIVLPQAVKHDPVAGGAVHQPLQGHVPHRDHRPERPGGDRPVAAGDQPVPARHAGGLRLPADQLLRLLLPDVVRQPRPGEAAGVGRTVVE